MLNWWVRKKSKNNGFVISTVGSARQFIIPREARTLEIV